MARQAPNVSRMRLLGAEVVGVDAGSKTLKDAINEAMRDWTENVATTHYVLGSALGPHPYPDDGARVPVGDRPGGARPVPQARGPRSARRRRVRGRRLERDRSLLGVPRDPRGSSTASRRGARGGAGRARGALRGRRRGRAPRNADDAAPGRGRAGAADALGLGRARLSGRRARARRAPRPRPGDVHEGVRRRGARRLRARCASSRESCRPSSPRTPSPSPRSSPGSGRARPGSSSTSPAGATRTSTSTCARGAARRRDAHRRRLRARPRPRTARPSSAYLTAGDPSPDATVGLAQGARPRRGGRAGARRALLRSDRGRPRASARGVAGARGRHDARDRLRDCAAHPRRDGSGARPLLVPEPDPASGRGPRPRGRARGRLRRGAPDGPSAGGGVPGRSRTFARRASTRSSSSRRRLRRPAWPRPRGSRAGFSTSSRARARPVRDVAPAGSRRHGAPRATRGAGRFRSRSASASRRPSGAGRAASLADGVVVGSALVRAAEEAGRRREEAVETLARSLVLACRRNPQ